MAFLPFCIHISNNLFLRLATASSSLSMALPRALLHFGDLQRSRRSCFTVSQLSQTSVTSVISNMERSREWEAQRSEAPWDTSLWSGLHMQTAAAMYLKLRHTIGHVVEAPSHLWPRSLVTSKPLFVIDSMTFSAKALLIVPVSQWTKPRKASCTS